MVMISGVSLYFIEHKMPQRSNDRGKLYTERTTTLTSPPNPLLLNAYNASAGIRYRNETADRHIDNFADICPRSNEKPVISKLEKTSKSFAALN